MAERPRGGEGKSREKLSTGRGRSLPVSVSANVSNVPTGRISPPRENCFQVLGEPALVRRGGWQLARRNVALESVSGAGRAVGPPPRRRTCLPNAARSAASDLEERLLVESSSQLSQDWDFSSINCLGRSKGGLPPHSPHATVPPVARDGMIADSESEPGWGNLRPLRDATRLGAAAFARLSGDSCLSAPRIDEDAAPWEWIPGPLVREWCRMHPALPSDRDPRITALNAGFGGPGTGPFQQLGGCK